MRMERLRKRLAVFLFLVACTVFANGSYIQAKALLAQWLLAQAWQSTLDGNQDVKPWSWADIWPVARLRYSKPDEIAGEASTDLYVLNEASGQGLAFGPAQLDPTVTPGQPGWLMIGGHRDTHFLFMQNLSQGEKIELQGADGQWHAYVINAIHIIDSDQQTLPVADSVTEPNLMLVTCYPFDITTAGGSLRYVVTAKVE